MEQLTPQRAIKILEEATGQVPATRQTHALMIEAVRTLEREFPPEDQPPSQASE